LELYIDLVENNLYNVKMLKTEVGNGTWKVGTISTY
jgi:hypothetical protein